MTARIMRTAFVVIFAMGPTGACEPERETVVHTVGARHEETLPMGQVPLAAGWDASAFAPRPLLPPLPVAISVPSRIEGTLAQGDATRPGTQGALADHYLLSLTARQPVTIVARGGHATDSGGGNLDMFLYLYFDRAQVAQDDDSATDGGALNSRIVYTPSATGVYTLRVTTFGGNLHTGEYVLEVYEGALPTQL